MRIAGNKGVLTFVELIAPFCIIKQQQLWMLREIALYQDTFHSNFPYDHKTLSHLLGLRDAVFMANTWSRSRIKQKYPKEQVLAEHTFINLYKWQESRKAAIERAQKAFLAKRRSHATK